MNGITEVLSTFDDANCKPTVLANARKLIEDKTRFELEEVQPVSESENLQQYEIAACHVLDATPAITDITGHFEPCDHDKRTLNPIDDARNEVPSQLRQASRIIDDELGKPNSYYRQIEPGVLLHHPHKYWNLYPCGGCAGVGSNLCGACSGRGRVTCHQCSGGGRVKCNCMGGRVSCSYCGGRGNVPHQVQYSVYVGGTNQIRYRTEYRPCYSCHGGQVTCSRCGGTSYISCPSCSGVGDLTCSGCAGSGRIMCEPCEGSGHVGQASWVDVRVNQEYSLNLPEDASQDVKGMAEREGLHGLPPISENFKFIKCSTDNPESPGSVTALYSGAFRVVHQEVVCDGESSKLIAYGNDLRWWTLDGLIEKLLEDDLRALSHIVVASANEGLFSVEVSHLLEKFKDVAASEINIDMVEAALTNGDVIEHRGAVSEEYATNLKHSVQAALRRIYVRRAKDLAWKTALAGLLLGILAWLIGGVLSITAILALSVGVFVHRRSIRALLTNILGNPEDAKRAIKLVKKGPGGVEAIAMLVIPSASFALGMLFSLPTQSPFANKELGQSIAPTIDHDQHSTLTNERTASHSAATLSHGEPPQELIPIKPTSGSKQAQNDSTLDPDSEGRLEFAEAQIAQKDYASALELAGQVLAKYPGNARALRIANEAESQKDQTK